MTTPEPNASSGDALLHGRATSGRRMVENTLTTALSASWAIAGLGSAAGWGAAPAPGASAPASNQPQSTKRSAGLMMDFLAGWTRGILTQKLKLAPRTEVCTWRTPPADRALGPRPERPALRRWAGAAGRCRSALPS